MDEGSLEADLREPHTAMCVAWSSRSRGASSTLHTQAPALLQAAVGSRGMPAEAYISPVILSTTPSTK